MDIQGERFHPWRDRPCRARLQAARSNACARRCWRRVIRTIAFPAGTRTAADAAAAVGCTIAQIAKSIVFRPKGDNVLRPAVVIASGANRVDQARAEFALGVRLGRADADWVRQVTGFAIGGVAPVGHLTPPLVLLDEDLLALDPVWAAAGSPSHVFRTAPAALMRLTGAAAAAVRSQQAGSTGPARSGQARLQ